MLRILPIWLAALVVAVFTQIAWAADSPVHGRGPERLFGRLDANDDGRISMDEVPEQAPDRLKSLLRRADADGDKVVTKGELAQAMRVGRPGPPVSRDRATAVSNQEIAVPCQRNVESRSDDLESRTDPRHR
ncbi:MAG TPA: hypothetical protein EYP56_10890, partial [Planctomycetaceae bacterium]|nr:hypothetical protein [Planctomycetaceae bacterium]